MEWRVLVIFFHEIFFLESFLNMTLEAKDINKYIPRSYFIFKLEQLKLLKELLQTQREDTKNVMCYKS